MDINHTTGTKMPSQEHLNFINKLPDSKIPRQSQLIANRLFMKNFPRETTSAEIEACFQSFGAVHDVKIIAKENTHFAFISFVNDNTAYDVLRQHAIVPITFQNRPIILAPAYKKNNLPPSTSPSSYYPAHGSAMTPPPTPSRTGVNGMSQPGQPSTPFQQHHQHQHQHQQQQQQQQHQHQHQQQQQQQQQANISAPQPVYPPIFFPVQANMPFLPMTGTYLVPQATTAAAAAAHHHPQLPASFYPTFYTQGATHQTGGQLINGHTYVPPAYMYSMGPPAMPGAYPLTTTNDLSMSSEY